MVLPRSFLAASRGGVIRIRDVTFSQQRPAFRVKLASQPNVAAAIKRARSKHGRCIIYYLIIRHLQKYELRAIGFFDAGGGLAAPHKFEAYPRPRSRRRL